MFWGLGLGCDYYYNGGSEYHNSRLFVDMAASEVCTVLLLGLYL